MGEYFKPFNVTKQEYIHPHQVDCGLKLAEWLHPESNVIRLACRWSATDDIRILSDYGTDIRVTESAKASDEVVDYDTACDAFKENNRPDGLGTPPRAFYEAAREHIHYEGAHEAWEAVK